MKGINQCDWLIELNFVRMDMGEKSFIKHCSVICTMLMH